jgi:hypothetical protein
VSDWLRIQEKCYNKKSLKSKKMMDLWKELREKYPHCILSNNDLWIENLKKTEKYMIEHNARPPPSSKNEEIRIIGDWLCNQIIKFTCKRNIMKNEIYYNMFKEFLEKHEEYFRSKETIWKKKLNQADEYITLNNKKPSSSSKDKEEKQRGKWIEHQIKYYNTKGGLMKNKEIYDLYSAFLTKHKNLFK